MCRASRRFFSTPTPRRPLPETLPELRATFNEQAPVRVSKLGSVDHATYDELFRSVCQEALDSLTSEDHVTRAVVDSRWIEIYNPMIESDDTILLGLRANLRYDEVAHGTFEHSYIAWSKAQKRTLAQGGASISCERDSVRTPVPESWVYRLEVDHGDNWASVQILEFRRAMGLGNDGSQPQQHVLDDLENDREPG